MSGEILAPSPRWRQRAYGNLTVGGAERIGRSADTRPGGPMLPSGAMSPLVLTALLALGTALSFWVLDRYVGGCERL